MLVAMQQMCLRALANPETSGGDQASAVKPPTSGDRIGVSRRRPEKSNIRECLRLDQRPNVPGISLSA
jgi:hypothetical protein